MVDMTDLKSVEHKSLVWVRLPPLVRCNDSETNGGTDAKHEMETGVLYSDTNRTAVTLFLGGLAQLARALDLHSRGRGFDSLILHHKFN